MSELTVCRDAEEAAGTAAEMLVEILEEARAERGVAHLALAGGSTPRRIYELLAVRLESFDGVELWFGDERAVPHEHPDSNYALVAETLLAAASIPPERVHRMEGEREPDVAAARYAQELERGLPADEDGFPVLDVALLGVGEDGHTASIFPGDMTPMAGGLCVAVHGAPKPPPDRITLTFDAFAAARRLVIVATGEAKREAAAAVVEGGHFEMPASLVAGPRAHVILDEAAAPDLSALEDRIAASPPLQHVSLETRPAEVSACRDFYRLLGFEATLAPGELALRSVWLERAGHQIHLLLADDPVVPPRSHFAVLLDDYEGTLAALTAAGHEVEPRAEHWGSPRAYVRDPAGHLLELMAFAPPPLPDEGVELR
ncbi:MAG: 6-phosphogluconolactonase [Thermoleophilaceae bacterium]